MIFCKKNVLSAELPSEISSRCLTKYRKSWVNTINNSRLVPISFGSNYPISKLLELWDSVLQITSKDGRLAGRGEKQSIPWSRHTYKYSYQPSICTGLGDRLVLE
jgi:hypothetical protein